TAYVGAGARAYSDGAGSESAVGRAGDQVVVEERLERRAHQVELERADAIGERQAGCQLGLEAVLDAIENDLEAVADGRELRQVHVVIAGSTVACHQRHGLAGGERDSRLDADIAEACAVDRRKVGRRLAHEGALGDRETAGALEPDMGGRRLRAADTQSAEGG